MRPGCHLDPRQRPLVVRLEVQLRHSHLGLPMAVHRKFPLVRHLQVRHQVHRLDRLDPEDHLRCLRYRCVRDESLLSG